MAQSQEKTIARLRTNSAEIIGNDCAKIVALAVQIIETVQDGGTGVVSSANRLAGLGEELARHAALLSVLGDLENRDPQEGA